MKKKQPPVQMVQFEGFPAKVRKELERKMYQKLKGLSPSAKRRRNRAFTKLANRLVDAWEAEEK